MHAHGARRAPARRRRCARAIARDAALYAASTAGCQSRDLAKRSASDEIERGEHDLMSQ
eukprot:COSAG02_NODE_351_length_24060_cov_13.046910_3_plen_59_part_00